MLYAFGDSFTFGQGMPDIGNLMGGTPKQTSKHVWPAHLAKLLNTEVENNSRGGASMLYITKLFLDNYHKIEPGDIVCVMWTYLERWSVLLPKDRPDTVLNLLPNMKRTIDHEPILEEYLPFTNTTHKIEMFCMLSNLIASMCKNKGVHFHQKLLDRFDVRDFKKHKPDWYDLYVPTNAATIVHGRTQRINKVTGLNIDRMPDHHSNPDTHIYWANVMYREILRSSNPLISLQKKHK